MIYLWSDSLFGLINKAAAGLVSFADCVFELLYLISFDIHAFSTCFSYALWELNCRKEQYFAPLEKGGMERFGSETMLGWRSTYSAVGEGGMERFGWDSLIYVSAVTYVGPRPVQIFQVTRLRLFIILPTRFNPLWFVRTLRTVARKNKHAIRTYNYLSVIIQHMQYVIEAIWFTEAI